MALIYKYINPLRQFAYICYDLLIYDELDEHTIISRINKNFPDDILDQELASEAQREINILEDLGSDS